VATASQAHTVDLDIGKRDISAPLFLNTNTDIHRLNRERLILPCLTGSFHPSCIEEYAVPASLPLQKQLFLIHMYDLFCLYRNNMLAFNLRPILEIWRRCFASLPANATPVRNVAAKILTSTYDNFIQTAGIRDGSSTAPNFSRGFMILLTPPMLLVLTLTSST